VVEFDPIKAAREQLIGLHEILSTFVRMERRAEEAISAAEGDLNAIRKLRGFCEGEIRRFHEALAELERRQHGQT
jgi:hypothetical protein